MTSYGYIILDSCIISFNLNWIMHLTQLYDIATKVSCRKNATTFGDLPDWFSHVDGDNEFMKCMKTT